MRVQLTAVLAAIVVLGLPEGAQAYYVDISITGAGRVYETTDANELDEHCPDQIEGFASPATTPTGSPGAFCKAGSAAGDYGWNWVVRYLAEPASGYRFDGWHSDGRTNPGPVLCDGSNGSSDYSGLACQFATTADLQVRARFVDDTPPPIISLSGPNQVVNGAATFSFGAMSDPTLRFVECRVAGVHEWQTCQSGHTENPPTGTYNLQVRARDWSNNLSPASTWTWTVDKVAPETSLVSSGPSGSDASTSATFEFSSNESGSFECTLDGSAVGCGSPKTYSGLDEGAHTFSVRARDTAGNYDPTPATRTWTVAGTSTGTGGGGTTAPPQPPPPPPPASPAPASPAPPPAPPSSPPAPPPAPSPVAPNPVVAAAYRTVGAKTTFSSLVVRNAAPGSTVKLTCKGRGCPLRSKSFYRVSGRANLLKPLKRKRLRAGAVVEIRVTGPAGDLKVVRYTMRRGKLPARTTRCGQSGGRLTRCR